eukprot:3572575-Pyramimonas_sp.AAC.1
MDHPSFNSSRAHSTIMLDIQARDKQAERAEASLLNSGARTRANAHGGRPSRGIMALWWHSEDSYIQSRRWSLRIQLSDLE